MTRLFVSALVISVLINLIQTVHPRKLNSQRCGPSVTEDGLKFHGNDQIIIPGQQDFSVVQFEFRTRENEGRLLLLTSSASAVMSQSLELADGKIVFRFNHSSGSTMMISRKRYNDGNWHVLAAKQLSDIFNLIIDGIEESSVRVPENYDKLYVRSVLYFGGFRETHLELGMTTKGFKGYLRNVLIGNTTIDLNSHNHCIKQKKKRQAEEPPTVPPTVPPTSNYISDVIEPIPVCAYNGSTNIELRWGWTQSCTTFKIHFIEQGLESASEDPFITETSIIDHSYSPEESTNDPLFTTKKSINGDPYTNGDSYTTEERHIEIKKLKPNTAYEFIIHVGLSDKSEVDSTRIRCQTTQSNSNSLIVERVTESSISLSWTTKDSTGTLELDIFPSEGKSKENVSGKNEYRFNSLRPGTEYTVTLGSADGTWNISRTIKTKINYLKDFKCNSGESEGVIQCTWDRGHGNGCGVTYHLNVADHDIPSVHYPQSSTNAIGLRAGQRYSVSIHYSTVSYRSETVNTTAVARPGVSATFFGKFGKYSEDNITLTYEDDPERVIEHYIIHRMDLNNSYKLSSNDSEVLFINLTAGTHYKLSAVAVSNGVMSAPLTVNVSTVPNPPSSVSCINQSNTTLTVKIGQPESGTFDHYQIFIDGSEFPDNNYQEKERNDNGAVAILMDRKPFRNHTIQVKFTMKFQNLASSQTVDCRCQTMEGIPGVVTGLENTTFAIDRLGVKWNPPAEPNGLVTYVVKVQCHHAKQHETFYPQKPELMIENIPKTRHNGCYVKVAAKTSAGEGSILDAKFILKEYDEPNTLLIVSLLILVLLLIVLIGLLGYYFIRKSPSRMQSVRRISSRFLHQNNEVRYFKQPAVSSKPVKISDFVAYVEKLEKDSGLKLTEEYEDLKFVGRNQSRDEAELQCNRAKNRFTNILPYDISRVKLLAMEDEEGSDYINASWIPGFHSKREFIASQGPLPSTVNDFWRMIWENSCQAIVMLTMCMEKGHIKCEQYWPVQSEPVCYGDVKVELQNEEKDDERHIREFKISMGSQSRKLIHFHYVTWPDMYVPEKMSLIAFTREIRTILNKNSGKGPIVVHCSAGVGRSGTFIALDTLLHQIQANHDLDIYGVVFQMRMNRVLMVQTEAQYTFIYECLKDILEDKTEPSEKQIATESSNDDEKTKDCEEVTKKAEVTESSLSSSSKDEKHEDQNSESTDEKQTEKEKGSTDETKRKSINDDVKTSVEETSASVESKADLKTNDDAKVLEIKSQDLSNDKESAR